jgi:hypothetical protein
VRCTARHSEAALYTPEIQGSQIYTCSELDKTAGRVRAYSPHERVSRAPKPSLAEKQNAGNPSSAGAGRRSTADLCLRPTTVIKILKLKLASSESSQRSSKLRDILTDRLPERTGAASASEVGKRNKSNSAKFSILNSLKTNLPPTDAPNRRPCQNHKVLMEDVPNERMKNLRSSLSRAIVLKLLHHT